MLELLLTQKAAQAGTSNGQQEFTTAGTVNWTVPAGVTNVCVVCVGSGIGSGSNATSPGTSSFNNSVYAFGSSYAVGGNFSGADGGGRGGAGGNGRVWSLEGYPDDYIGGGGGGAGGYTGNGGAGIAAGNAVSTDGYRGGGVGILGAGASGAAILSTASSAGSGGGGGGGSGGNGRTGGNGGSGGSNGGLSAVGGLYGGGNGGVSSGNGYGGGGLAWKNNIAVTPGQIIPIKVGDGGGAVRVIWGPGRAFPSTLTGNL